MWRGMGNSLLFILYEYVPEINCDEQKKRILKAAPAEPITELRQISPPTLVSVHINLWVVFRSDHRRAWRVFKKSVAQMKD